MAALSESALPSGSTSVGIWPSGFSFSSSAKASFCSHEAVSTMRLGAPMIASAASTDADPEPFLPYSVYIASSFGVSWGQIRNTGTHSVSNVLGYGPYYGSDPDRL